MKAIILAAGRGSRLGRLTDNIPKALLSFNGIPLIERTVRTMRAAGVNEIGIVTGYQGHLLEPYADYVFTNPLWHSTGIAHSLGKAEQWLDSGPCLVSYGDIFYPVEIVQDLMKSDFDIVLAYDPKAVEIWKQRFDNPLDDLERFMVIDGDIRQIGHRADSLEQINGQYMGLFKLSPNGWRSVKTKIAQISQTQQHVDMTSLFSMLIKDGISIRGTPSAQPWGEIDCPSDLTLYERLYCNI